MALPSSQGMKTAHRCGLSFGLFLPGDQEVCLESRREQPEGRADGCDTGSKVAEYLRLMFQTTGCPALQGKEPQMAGCWYQGPWNPAVPLFWPLNAAHYLQEAMDCIFRVIWPGRGCSGLGS